MITRKRRPIRSGGYAWRWKLFFDASLLREGMRSRWNSSIWRRIRRGTQPHRRSQASAPDSQTDSDCPTLSACGHAAGGRGPVRATFDWRSEEGGSRGLGQGVSSGVGTRQNGGRSGHGPAPDVGREHGGNFPPTSAGSVWAVARSCRWMTGRRCGFSLIGM